MSWSTRRQKVAADALRSDLQAALDEEHKDASAAQQSQQFAALDAAEALADALAPDGEAAEFNVSLNGPAAGPDGPVVSDSVTVTVERTA